MLRPTNKWNKCYNALRQNILIKHPYFALPRKKALEKSDIEYEEILIDATESPIERPKENKKLKTQVIISKKSKKIICTNFSTGKKHDFRLFKESKIWINSKIKIQVDKGYQGIIKIHKNSELPKKKSKKNPLANEDKMNNRKISSERIGGYRMLLVC